MKVAVPTTSSVPKLVVLAVLSPLQRGSTKSDTASRLQTSCFAAAPAIWPHFSMPAA